MESPWDFGRVLKTSCYASQVTRWWRICLPTQQMREIRWDPWVRKIPCRGRQQPTPVFLPEKSHWQRSWQATVHVAANSQALLSVHPRAAVSSGEKDNPMSFCSFPCPLSSRMVIITSSLPILTIPWQPPLGLTFSGETSERHWVRLGRRSGWKRVLPIGLGVSPFGLVFSHFSRVWLFVIPRIACQAPLSLGILQARILEWVAMPSSRGSSQPRDRTCLSCVSSTAGPADSFFTSAPPEKPPLYPFPILTPRMGGLLFRAMTSRFSWAFRDKQLSDGGKWAQFLFIKARVCSSHFP